MDSSLLAIGVFAVAALILLGSLWWLVPTLSGLPWVPTRPQRIRKALQLARLQPGEVVIDLGAGDGRALCIAAREFGAYATGIEISPVHCLIGWLRARLTGLGDRVRIRWGDFCRADLSQADVVFAYLTSRQALRLQPHLVSQLRPGTRLVTVSFEFEGWQPVAFDPEDLLFLYSMPPQPGGLDPFLAQNDQRVADAG